MRFTNSISHLAENSRLRGALLVGVGAMFGTSLRYTLDLLWTPRIAMPLTEASIRGVLAMFPWDIAAINVICSFLLGYLTTYLTRSAVARANRHTITNSQDLQLLLGTGVLGGFTTYSAIAVASAQLIAAHPVLTTVFIGSQIIVGILATWCAWWLASRNVPSSGMREAVR